MKKELFIILFICMSFLGCTKKNTNNTQVTVIEDTDNNLKIQNELETEEKNIPDIDIESREYYRINSPEGLRVRESPSLNSNIIDKYPDNYVVFVRNINNDLVEIDGIKSYWVEISHNTDPTGWVFGGYLKPSESFPSDALGVNDYRYTDYKYSYGEFTPSVIDSNWESFYIFSKDYVGEPQQFDLDAYDMYTNITYDTYKIFTGLYKDKQGNEGYFIVKTDLEEKTVLDKLVQDSNDSHYIVFLKPWSSDSEYLSVGRRFESECMYYISKNKLSEKIQFTDY